MGDRFDFRTSTVEKWRQWTGQTALLKADNILKTMMSRISTINPMTPPLDAYVQVLPTSVAASFSSPTGAASDRAVQKSWTRMLEKRMLDAMVVVEGSLLAVTKR